MNTKDNWLTTITIHDEVRAAVWGAIFPGARVPVLSIVPALADLPGIPRARVYFLDLAAISDDQMDQLVHKMADLFSLDPASVRQDMTQTGVPILADSTSLESSDRALVMDLVGDLEETEMLETFELLEEADAAGLEEIDPSLAGVDDWSGKELDIDDDGGDDE